MSSLFSALDISNSGVDAMQTWIDASAGNIANSEDATTATGTAYEDQVTEFTPVSPTSADGVGAGVEATVVSSGNTGNLSPEPDNPIANSDGEVKTAAVSTSDELVNLMSAQDGYQANTTAISRATAAYQAALTIGG